MPEASIAVRDATADDADFIVDCNVALAEESEGKTLDRALLAEGVRKGFARPEMARYFVAQCDGERAGMTMLTYELTDWRSGVVWWLQSVYVLPAFRQRGVFRAIYAHIERLGREDPEARGLRLYVLKNNHRALRTYEAMGMSASGFEVYEHDWP
jgi:ribosomal protein S18 acetylase RimI-like enzyme